MREESEAQRRCIVSGEVLPREQLLRFVISPDGQVVPDLGEELPGRGLWLQADRDMIRAACAKRAFSRAARCEARAPDDLDVQVERLLRRRCLDLIGLARRAGALAIGYEGVRAFLAGNVAGLLLAACDGAADGRRKIRALAPDVALIDLFDSAELGAAAGREHLVHAAVAQGKLAERIMRDCRRLAGLRLAPVQGGTA